jgi:hypothetical protein
MSYIKHQSRQTTLEKEFLRFEIKIIFCFLLILLLIYGGFNWALGFLLLLFIPSVFVFRFYKKKDNAIARFFFNVEREYEEGFPGKEATLSLLGFITIFVFAWALQIYIDFPITWALVIGLIILGFANNLASLILWKAKHQYMIYGTSLEYLVLASLIGSIILIFFGMPFYIALFIAFGTNLFLLIPWLDHNFSTFIMSSLLYMLLFL